MDSRPRSRTPLKDELRKRRTQQIQREIEARQKLRSPEETPHATAQAVLKQPPSVAARTHPRGFENVTSRMQRRKTRTALLIMGSTIAAIVVCGITLFLFAPRTNTTSGSPETLPPVVSAQEFVNYLKATGIPIMGLLRIPDQNEIQPASQEYQFDVVQGNLKGVFLVLSYPSPPLAGKGSFSVRFSSRFKNWQQITRSNILLLISPDSAQPISEDIADHLSHYVSRP